MVIIDDLKKLNNFIFRKIVSMRKISKSSKYAKKAREIVQIIAYKSISLKKVFENPFLHILRQKNILS